MFMIFFFIAAMLSTSAAFTGPVSFFVFVIWLGIHYIHAWFLSPETFYLNFCELSGPCLIVVTSMDIFFFWEHIFFKVNNKSVLLLSWRSN